MNIIYQGTNNIISETPFTLASLTSVPSTSPSFTNQSIFYSTCSTSSSDVYFQVSD